MFEEKLLHITSYNNIDFRIIRKCHKESIRFADSIIQEEAEQMLEHMFSSNKDINEISNKAYMFKTRNHYIRYTIWKTSNTSNSYDCRIKSALDKNIWPIPFGVFKERLKEGQLSLFQEENLC